MSTTAQTTRRRSWLIVCWRLRPTVNAGAGIGWMSHGMANRPVPREICLIPKPGVNRDYVIAAINKDKPYDQLIHEQIAGDLLDHKDDAEREEHIIATGFLALGVKDVNQRFKVRYVMDNIDDQIDTVSRAFLGLNWSVVRVATITSSIPFRRPITTHSLASSIALICARDFVTRWGAAVSITTTRKCCCRSGAKTKTEPERRATRKNRKSQRSRGHCQGRI